MNGHYDGIMRFLLAAALAACFTLSAQIIPFESNGLQYKTLTKGGVTVMFAYLPAHLKEYSIMQISISNGSPISWTVKPEDFSYRQQDGTVWQAATALSVVNNLLAKAGRHDVIKLVTTYERGVYGNEHMQTTNGYEARRQSALAEGVSRGSKPAPRHRRWLWSPPSSRLENPPMARSFSPVNGKVLGPGTLMVHTGGEMFEFPSDGEPAGQVSGPISPIGYNSYKRATFIRKYAASVARLRRIQKCVTGRRKLADVFDGRLELVKKGQ